MKKVNVNLKENSYPIYICEDYGNIGKCLLENEIKGQLFLITDSNVDKYQSNQLINELKQYNFDIYKYVLDAGEASKNLTSIENIYKFLMSLKCDRNSTLIALGGGVVGDVVGFVAATYLRGIRFVQVPTSLLAQVDSSVGGKVGVNFNSIKNIIGAFYQPKLVYINVNSLLTLPQREFRSGLGEVIVHSIIKEEGLFNYIDNNIAEIFNYNKDVLKKMIHINCSIKKEIVEKDEKDTGIRAILNFGHTIGHAIESTCGFKLLHGECISIGIIGAFKIANYLGLVGKEPELRVKKTLEMLGLPIETSDLDINEVFNKMLFDKKVTNNKLMFILPKSIGEVVVYNVNDEELIKKVLKELIL